MTLSENKPRGEPARPSSNENPIKEWADAERTLSSIFGADFVNKDRARFEAVFLAHGWQVFSELMQSPSLPSLLAPLDKAEEQEGAQILDGWFAKYGS